jgi:hypothetical protein
VADDADGLLRRHDESLLRRPVGHHPCDRQAGHCLPSLALLIYVEFEVQIPHPLIQETFHANHSCQPARLPNHRPRGDCLSKSRLHVQYLRRVLNRSSRLGGLECIPGPVPLLDCPMGGPSKPLSRQKLGYPRPMYVFPGFLLVLYSCQGILTILLPSGRSMSTWKGTSPLQPS